MPVSPMDFELYSRVTGSPMPMSAAERMKMAPEVYQFTKDYTKSQNRQAMGRNILKIGAIGAGLGGALYLANKGSRDFGTPSQELGQDLVETSTATNLVENAAEKAAQSVGSNTVSQSIVKDQTPDQTLENAVETAEEPSMLNKVESQTEDAPLLGAEAIREKYSSSRVKNPARRARELESDMIGSESSGPDMLRNFVTGMTKKELSYADEDGLVDTQLQSQSLSGTKGIFSPLVDDSSSTLTATQYGAYASPLTDHPDMEGGEDDAGLPSGNNNFGGTNTSATVKITKDPKTVGIASSLPKTVGKTPEEKIVIASIVNEKRQPSPNELAGKDQAAFEAIQAGIPKEEQEAAAKRVKEKTAIKRAQTTGEKVDDFKAKFVEGAKSDIVRGRMGNKSLGITRIPPTNGDAQVGFVLANKPVDQSPRFAETYAYGVAPDAESMLDNQLDEKSFSTYMQRAMKEAKKGKKRVAGEIFEYLTPNARVIEGDARLGDIEM